MFGVALGDYFGDFITIWICLSLCLVLAVPLICVLGKVRASLDKVVRPGLIFRPFLFCFGIVVRFCRRYAPE